MRAQLFNNFVASLRLFHLVSCRRSLPPPQPLRSNNMKDIVPEWDAAYVDIDQEQLFELLLAANYLDIAPLLNLVSAKVATLIKGKTAEEIRRTFNIRNDFTPEEEAQVREENRWAEEL